MTKRVVIRVAARGYVDGRYIGEEKEVIESIDPSGRGKRRRGKSANASAADARGNRGNRGASSASGAPSTSKRGVGTNAKRGRNTRSDNIGNTAGSTSGEKRPRGRRSWRPAAGTANFSANGNAGATPPRGNKRGRVRGAGNATQPVGHLPQVFGAGNFVEPGFGNSSAPSNRRNRGGKKTPFRAPQANSRRTGQRDASPRLISEVAETRRWGDESKSGQFAEALSKEANIKRERLHKVLAQSGHGSRRDMEIMISSGRVMVNGIIATTGLSVSANDVVMIDHKPIKLKFNEELPRVLLYHKPDGEIVTTNDPGNRITVFDNLPPVVDGKWMSIGRLDINTSGLLIFTTSGELANRLMHPRYEVEREYAVRVLGELTDVQEQQLLSGVSISAEASDDEDEVVADDRPAKFDSIEKRGGEGANQWYHVVLREGRNREVRKMFEAVGLTVSRLIRVRFGKIGLPPRLTRGRMLELDPSQVRAVLKWVGMEVEGHIGQLPTNHQPERGRQRAPQGARAGANVGSNSAADATEATDGVNADSTQSIDDAVAATNAEAGRGERNESRPDARRSRLHGRRGSRQQARPERGVVPPTSSVDFVAGELALADFNASHAPANAGDGVADAGIGADVNTSAGKRDGTRGSRRGRNMRRHRGERGDSVRGQRTPRADEASGAPADGVSSANTAGIANVAQGDNVPGASNASATNAAAASRVDGRSSSARHEGGNNRRGRQQQVRGKRGHRAGAENAGNVDDNLGNRVRQERNDIIDDDFGNR